MRYFYNPEHCMYGLYKKMTTPFLERCDKCIQMTNHVNGVCQKCPKPFLESALYDLDNHPNTLKVLTDFEKQIREEVVKEVRYRIEEYFGHISNDGVTGNPMNVSIEEIGVDILTLPILKIKE